MKKFIPLLALLLLTACGKGVSTGEKDPALEVWETKIPVGGKVVDERHGEEGWFAYGALTNTTELPANGVAKAHRFANGTMLITMQFNVSLPENGTFYEGWVINGQDWVSLGHLSSVFGDERHSARHETEKDLRTYKEVAVTLEQDNGNPNPSGNVVGKGTLRVTER